MKPIFQYATLIFLERESLNIMNFYLVFFTNKNHLIQYPSKYVPT